MMNIAIDLPKPLTEEETKDLFRNWCDDSKKVLAERNMRLAMKVANSFHNTGIDDEELFATAMLGLVIATQRFDPNKGCKFTTFATSVITNEILKLFRKRKYHPYPTESLDDTITNDKDGSSCTRGDLIPSSFRIEDYALYGSLKDIVETEFQKESDRNRKIIYLCLNGMQQEEAGRRAGISQPQVFRIMNKFKNRISKEYAR